MLEAESGFVMETPEVAQFRSCVIDGQWALAEEALLALGVTVEEGLSVCYNVSSLIDSLIDNGSSGGKILDKPAEVFGVPGSRKYNTSVTCAQR